LGKEGLNNFVIQGVSKAMHSFRGLVGNGSRSHDLFGAAMTRPDLVFWEQSD